MKAINALKGEIRLILPRKDDQQVNELFDTLEKLKGEFDYIERPTLEVETTTAKAETPSKVRLQKCLCLTTPLDDNM